MPIQSEVPADNVQPADGNPRIYTTQEVADILHINIRYVRENVRKHKWPSLSFGQRTIRFTQAHLDAILSLSEVPPPLPQERRRRTRRPTS